MKLLEKPLEITWEITNRCKLKCKHCYQNSSNSPSIDELETSFILNYLDKLKQLGVMIILWDGGDPLLHPDFLRILSKATKYFCCYISTNGTEIDASYAKKLKQSNVASIFLSFYGGNEKSHDMHTGIKGSFNKTINAITHLQSNGINPILTMLLMKTNIDEIEQFVSLCNYLKVSQCNFMRFYVTGRGKDKSQYLKPSNIQIQDFTSKISHIKTKVPIVHPFFPRLHNCCNMFFTITSTGDTTPCSYLREKIRLGNIKQTEILDIWNDNHYRKLRSTKVLGKCTTCVLYDDCEGGCRAAALEDGLEWHSPDPSCGYISSKGLKQTILNNIVTSVKKQDTYTNKVNIEKDFKIIKNDNIIERYIEEWKHCYIYNPSNTKIFILNFESFIAWGLISNSKTFGELSEKWIRFFRNSSISKKNLIQDLEKVLHNFLSDKLISIKK